MLGRGRFTIGLTGVDMIEPWEETETGLTFPLLRESGHGKRGLRRVRVGFGRRAGGFISKKASSNAWPLFER